MASTAITNDFGQLGGMKLRRPVTDLGANDPRLAGILSPGFSEQEIGQHVHDVFLKDAEAYLEFCPIDRTLIDHWKGLIEAALGEWRASKILDIGSGGGVTVFPTLELFPEAAVVATDLALPLLAALRNRAAENEWRGLRILQTNAEDTVFADAQADLVLGAHILHHAFSLERMLREVRRVLRWGGKAMFWEGFENGAQLLAGVFDTWLEMSPYQAEPLPEAVLWSLRSYLCDLERRVGRDKSDKLRAMLDDKWYFTKAHLRDLAAGAGFHSCAVHNIYGSHGVLRMMAAHELSRKGHSLAELPGWAFAKLLAIQARYSPDFLDENPFCCSIVLTV